MCLKCKARKIRDINPHHEYIVKGNNCEFMLQKNLKRENQGFLSNKDVYLSSSNLYSKPIVEIANGNENEGCLISNESNEKLAQFTECKPNTLLSNRHASAGRYRNKPKISIDKNDDNRNLFDKYILTTQNQNSQASRPSDFRTPVKENYIPKEDMQNMVLYAKQISDSNRFTRINVDFMKQANASEDVLNQYYSCIFNQKKVPTEINDLIPYPEQDMPNLNEDDSVSALKDTMKGNENNLLSNAQQLRNLSALKQANKISFSNIYNTNKYKYIVTPGNNSKLIREAMKTRPWWVEIPNVDSVFNFKWQPVSHRMKFRELVYKSVNKQIVNHFEYHKNLSEKSELLFNMQSHCEFIKANVFDIMPLQFFIKIDPK